MTESESVDAATVARARHRVDGLIVTGVWTMEEGRGSVSPGPSEVRVSIAPDAPALLRKRGINASALRRVEGILKDMTESTASSIERARATVEKNKFEFAPLLKAKVAELPSGPRSATDERSYYAELLDLFEMVDATEPDPVTVLATAMNVPVGTVRSRLRRARQLRDDG